MSWKNPYGQYWIPKTQVVRYTDGRKVVTRRTGTRDWTRTTTRPDGRRSVTTSRTELGPLGKLVWGGAGIVFAIVGPATLLGAWSIPLYILMVIGLVMRAQQWRSKHKATGLAALESNAKAPSAGGHPGQSQRDKGVLRHHQEASLRDYDESYRVLTDTLLHALDNVTSDESARVFIAEASERIRTAQSVTAEFYVGEFSEMLWAAALEKGVADLLACDSEYAEFRAAADEASVDLDESLRAARAIGDQATKHAIWRERQAKETEIQAFFDAAMYRASIAVIRSRAVRGVLSAFGFEPDDQPAAQRAEVADEGGGSARRRGGMVGIAEVWHRIVAHEGEAFRQVRGKVFTYEVDGKVLRPSTVNQNLAQGVFEQALARVPLSSTVDVQDLWGPSYLYAILMDERIRHNDW